MMLSHTTTGLLVGTLLLQGSTVLYPPGTQTAAEARITVTAVPLAQSNLPSEDGQPNIRLSDPPSEPLPETVPELPPAEELLQTPDLPETPIPDPEADGDRLCITGFEVLGSSVFSQASLVEVANSAVPETETCELTLDEVEAPLPGQALTLRQLQQVRDAITQFYIDANYITSGAYLPP